MIKKQKPDVVLMDIGMPVKDGIEATQIIKSTAENIKIIMLTSLQSADDVKNALKTTTKEACCLLLLQLKKWVYSVLIILESKSMLKI